MYIRGHGLETDQGQDVVRTEELIRSTIKQVAIPTESEREGKRERDEDREREREREAFR